MTLLQRWRHLGTDTTGLIIGLVVIVIGFSLASPRFLTAASFNSMGFQMPLLGLLTLAMLAPIISGGLNLAIVYTANISGLTLATVLIQMGGPEAGVGAFVLGCLAAVAVGMFFGAITGAIIAYVGAHPIIVSLAMMIFLRGLGEFLTRGSDISGFPEFVGSLGHGTLLGVPMPLVLFALVALAWHFLLRRTQHGFSTYMTGSNLRAAEYAGLPTRRTLVLIYTLSGLLCAIAGILMAARFNSVRVGHGEALLLVTVLASFLGGIDPFGGHGRVVPVIIALFILQVLSSGLNLIGANQHLATAIWGLFLVMVMVMRSDQIRHLLHLPRSG